MGQKKFRLRRRPVEGAEEWADGVWVRELTAQERLDLVAYRDTLADGPLKGLQFSERLISLAIVDEHGRPYCTEAEVRQFMSGPFIDHLCSAAAGMNGFSEEAREAVRKNSAAAPPSASLAG